MKYDTHISELKNKLDASSSVLVVLPKEVNVDKLAAALSLYLSLKQSGKTASIVSESELKVAQAALFGIGDIKSTLPESNTGNFVIKLDGVVEGGKVPALVNLDWFPSSNDLNLVFHVQPGKKFEPINISHHYDTASFQLIFFIAGATLGDFGTLYTNNLNQLGDAAWVNIDNSQNNNLFAAINIVDAQTSSVSEMVSQILEGLNLPQDADIATNIAVGIYEATQNLTVGVSGDTFIAIGQAMQRGGKVPFIQNPISQGGLDIRQFAKSGTSFDSAQDKFEKPDHPDSSDAFGLQTPQPSQPVEIVTKGDRPVGVVEADEQVVKSQYEVPSGEQVVAGNPESSSPAPDWLTPKIYKGGNLG